MLSSFLSRTLVVGLLAAVLAGCAGVTVRSADPANYLAERRSDVLTAGTLSPATQESLRVLDLDLKRCLADVPMCHYPLANATGLYDEQRMAALAELWIYQARQAQQAPSLPGTRTSAEVQAWLEAATPGPICFSHTGSPASAPLKTARARCVTITTTPCSRL